MPSWPRSTTRCGPRPRPPGPMPTTPCSWSTSTSTEGPTTTCRPRRSRPPTRRHRPASSASASTAPGVRVPALAISAWIPEHDRRQRRVPQHVDHQDHARAVGARRPVLGRDAVARDVAPVLSLDDTEGPEDWPDAVPQPLPVRRSAAWWARRPAAAHGPGRADWPLCSGQGDSVTPFPTPSTRASRVARPSRCSTTPSATSFPVCTSKSASRAAQ